MPTIALQAFTIGILLGLVAIAVGHVTGILRGRGAWAVALTAIASFYVVFAIEAGDWVIFHIFVAASFLVIAIAGHRNGAWILGAGLALHGLFDLAIAGAAADPAPSWWGSFCLGIDLIFAGYVLVMRDELAP